MQSKTFSVPKTLKIKNNNCFYNFDQLSQGVDYWLNHINQRPRDLAVGVFFSALSFSNLAFMLALIESGRSYERISALHKLDQDRIHSFGAIYISGDTYNSPYNFPSSHNIYLTDTFDQGYASSTWPGQHSLDITFKQSQEIIEYSSGSTGTPKKIIIDAWQEALSVETAIKQYFDPLDYCVFLHSMNHTGVHTSAILPAIFSVSTLSLANANTWQTEINHATHIQYFTTMRNFFPLPEKLRCLVFGGDMLKPLLTQHVIDNCKVENFWDVYGLTECLPPLAVRKITSVDDLDKDFLWVNCYHQPVMFHDGRNLLINRADGIIIDTGDIGQPYKLNQDIFVKMHGRSTQTVRVDGKLHSAEEFKIHLESYTNVSSHVLFWENDRAVLVVYQKDQPTITQYAKQFDLEAELRFQDELATSGGIKHIR